MPRRPPGATLRLPEHVFPEIVEGRRGLIEESSGTVDCEQSGCSLPVAGADSIHAYRAVTGLDGEEFRGRRTMRMRRQALSRAG